MITNLINLLVLVLLFLGSLLFNKLLFSILLFILAFLSLRNLFFIRPGERYIPAELKIISYIILLFFVINNYENNSTYYLIDYKLLTVLLLSGLIPLVIINNKWKYSLFDAFYLIGTTLFVGVTFNILFQLRLNNNHYVCYILVIAITTLLFELLFSKLVGKTILFPRINPKKSIEGIIGGITLGTLLSTIYYISTIATELPIYLIVIITFTLSIFGVMGNFLFTFIKKEYNKVNLCNYNFKNGGILDIIDSVVVMTLAFMLFESFL